MMFVSTLSALAMVYTATAWDYNNFEWSDSTNFCGSEYQTQSPINIDHNGLTLCPFHNALNWNFGEVTKYEMTNTGHSLQITPTFSGSNVGYLSNLGEKYCLIQFHIHWGRDSYHGSEHTIDGRAAAMEMHFVHYNCRKYDSFDAAKNSAEPGALAVVATFYIPAIHANQENIFLQHIIDQAYKVQNHGVTRELSGGSSYSINSLVPSNVHNNPTFFYYKGSLTTPSCDPIVDWYILADIMYVTEAQLHDLRTSLYDEHEQFVDHNCRPTQFNRNPVHLCGVIDSSDDSEDDD